MIENYIIEWEATELHGQVYSVTDDGDLPLIGMNTVGCEFTTCPVQSGIKQTYNYTLPLARKFPVVCIYSNVFEIGSMHSMINCILYGQM